MKTVLYSIILALLIFSCKKKPFSMEDSIVGTWKFSEASYQKGLKKIDVSERHFGKIFTFYNDNTFEIDSIGTISKGNWVVNYDYYYYDENSSGMNYELILSFSSSSKDNNIWIWKYVAPNKKRFNFSYQEDKKFISVKLLK